MFNNLNATLKKIIVVFLIITLTYANLVLIGSNIVNGLISYAAEETGEQPTHVANQELVMNKICEINGVEKRVIQFAIETGIEAEEYPIKQTTIMLHTDIILDQTYEDIVVTELNKNSYTSGTWEISEDGMVEISLVNENEELEAKDEGLDKLLVTYVYPNTEIETIKKPLSSVSMELYVQGDDVEGKGLGSNLSESYINEIETEGKEDLLLLNIENKDIHKTTVTEGQVEFTEKLTLDLSYRKDIKNIVVEDVENKFYNYEEINEEVALKYKTTTINKEDLISLLGDNGKLTITDAGASKVLVELTKSTLEAQEIDVKTEQKFVIDETVEEPTEEVRAYVTKTDDEVIVEYAVDVTNFRLALTDIKAQSENEIELSDLVITNTKSISNVDETNLENLNYLQEDVKYLIDDTEKTSSSIIIFKDTITKADLTVDNTEWVVGEANTVKYTITLDTTTEKSEMFVNPMFLIELPSSVESINTASSEFSVNNDNGAFTNKRVFVTTVLERKFVVITLEGEQTVETIQNGDTTIDLTLELNVAESTAEGNQTTKLYYQNDTVTAYESGKGFDTAEVTVSMIMESEPKEDIEEVVPDDGETTTPDEGGETTPDEEEETPDISLVVSNSTQQIVRPGEEFRYDIYILNNTNLERENLQLTSVLPEGISVVKVEEIENNESTEIEYTFDETSRLFTINIAKLEATIYETKLIEETGETDTDISLGNKTFQITVKAEHLPEGTYSRQIKNVMQLKQGETVLIESEELTNTISADELIVEIDELTENLNELEEFVLGVKLINKGLVDATNIDISLDVPEEIALNKYTKTVLLENGQEESTTQGTLTGNFEMNDLSVEAKTTYYFQIEGNVKELNGSKQITINGTVNGEEFSWTIGLIDLTVDPDNPNGSEIPTDPENPTNPDEPTTPEDPENPVNPEEPTDSENPDETDKPEDEKFDLSLNQYLNKVTVVNSKETTTYDYENTNFAKIEIHSKQMNGSKVTLEYNIIVKNEGTIPGYARKIADYIPSDLTFNAELNPDWYLGEDGNIYSVALIDKLLNPGETAEVKIILEKQMTNDNTGIIANLVEIYEASNSKNVEDINSTPGDRVEGQNDISKVEVMVVTSTGTIILYTTLAILVIAIIGIGFYRVKKVTLNKKGGC